MRQVLAWDSYLQRLTSSGVARIPEHAKASSKKASEIWGRCFLGCRQTMQLHQPQSSIEPNSLSCDPWSWSCPVLGSRFVTGTPTHPTDCCSGELIIDSPKCRVGMKAKVGETGVASGADDHGPGADREIANPDITIVAGRQEQL